MSLTFLHAGCLVPTPDEVGVRDGGMRDAGTPDGGCRVTASSSLPHVRIEIMAAECSISVLPPGEYTFTVKTAPGAVDGGTGLFATASMSVTVLP